MPRGYKILTVTHHDTKLQNLGQYAFSCEDTQLSDHLHRLKEQMDLEELQYLSTCNRIMYLFYTDQEIDAAFITAFFQVVNPKMGHQAEVFNKISVYEGKEAITHLFQVAASMNSMVIGEREILRQLREAYQKSYDFGLTGDHIRLAMKAAVEAAKQIYAQTRIGEKPISIVSLAIQKLLFQKLPRDARILLIGAGQTNTLVTKFLVKHEFTNVTVFNRSIDRAKHLANMVKGKALLLSQLADYQKGFDCLIICTGATEALIDSDLYDRLLAGETDTKLLIDLAIPNNINRQVVDTFNVKYIEIEDLRHLAKENLSFRQQEVVKGKKMLRGQLRSFIELHRQRQISKAMKSVPAEIKAVKAHAVNKVFKKEMENLDDEAKELVMRMLDYMEKQCIGIPMKAAKGKA